MLTQNAVSRETCHRTMDRAGVCGSKKSNEVLIASESVLLHGSLILKRMLQQKACSEAQDTIRSVPRYDEIGFRHLCFDELLHAEKKQEAVC